MEKNKRAPAHTKAKESEFLLTTKLFCGKCERMMVGESGKSHTGTIYYYYKCGNAKRKKGCDKKAVKKDWIERAVVRLTMIRVLDEEKINRIIDALLALQEQEYVTIPALWRQLIETEKGIGNLVRLARGSDFFIFRSAHTVLRVAFSRCTSKERRLRTAEGQSGASFRPEKAAAAAFEAAWCALHRAVKIFSKNFSKI